jgi:hypothetical protein
MIICDLNLMSISILPGEAQAVLIVNPDAVLALPVTP